MSEKTYIEFIEMPRMFPSERKTKVWRVQNKTHGDNLGEVKWYGGWRRYCFFPLDAVFSGGCLRDVAVFCDEQTAAHKAEPRR